MNQMSMNNMASRQPGNVVVGGQMAGHSGQQTANVGIGGQVYSRQQVGMSGPSQRVVQHGGVQQHVGTQQVVYGGPQSSSVQQQMRMLNDDQEAAQQRQRAAQEQLRIQLAMKKRSVAQAANQVHICLTCA